MTPATALAMVRRTRLRLELMRLVRAASRGALVGTVIAIVLLVLDRFASSAIPAMWLWLLAGIGAISGAVIALTRPGIRAASAALFLDARFATSERFVTLCANAKSRLAPRWAEELGDARPVPRIVWPREAGLAPVALFVLFVAGLLPSPEVDGGVVVPASESKSAANDATGSEGSGSGEESAEKSAPEAAAIRLGESRTLTPKEVAAVRHAIDTTFARPEDRRRAQAQLNAASAGNETAAKRLALALVKGAGALNDSGAESNAEAPKLDSPQKANGVRFASPYREEMNYLREYQVELARLRETK